MQRKYGRPPKKNEVIHHLDENPWNNAPDNLVYLPKGIHMWLHRWCNQGALAAYAEEIKQAIDHLKFAIG